MGSFGDAENFTWICLKSKIQWNEIKNSEVIKNRIMESYYRKINSTFRWKSTSQTIFWIKKMKNGQLGTNFPILSKATNPNTKFY